MNLLLDTHVWIWSQESPERIGGRARAALESKVNGLFVSTASTLEIARLLALGRIRLTMELSRWLAESLGHLRADTFEISHDIAVETYRLPHPFHKDPVDRLLAATARLNGLRLVTADESLLGYQHVEALDARG